jgi:hypothetical protein
MSPTWKIGLQYGVTGIVLIVATVAVFLATSRESDDHAVAYDRVTSADRRIRTIPSESVTIIPLDRMVSVLRDVQVVGSDLFVSDGKATELIRFSKDGKYLNHVVSGRGSGPTELPGFIDFAVTDSVVWLATLNTRRVTRFTVGGAPMDHFELPGAPYRLAGLSMESVFAFLLAQTKPLVQLRSDGTIGPPFGDVITEQGSMLTVTGRLAATDTNELIYVADYASVVLTFDTAGILKRSVQTFDRLPFPSMDTATVNGNTVARAPRPPIVVMDAESDAEMLYVATGYSGSPAYSILDAYLVESGEYVGSWHLPDVYKGFDVENDTLYAVVDTAVVSFALPLH